MFDHRKILKQAWLLTKANRFLWIFGLFLLLGETLNLPFGNEEKINVSKTVMVLMVLSWLVIFILYLRSKAGIILALKAILEKQTTSFTQAFKLGENFFTRILVTLVLVDLIILIISAIVSTPIIYLWTAHLTTRALILTIFGALILIPVWILSGIVTAFLPIYITFYNFSVKQALAATVDLISSFWKQLVVYYLLISIIVLCAFILAAIIVSPFVISAILAYHKEGSLPQIIFVLSIVIGSVIFLWLGSIIRSFQQTIWVLTFKEIVKPQKLEEEETLPAPEVIS